MKVAIVAGPYVPVPPRKYGGTELVIANLIRGLREMGHEPILLASGDSTIDCPTIPIVDKAMFFPKHRRDLPEYGERTREIEKTTATKLREILPEVDIIHSHGFDLKDFQNFPNLTTMHGPVTFQQLPYYERRRGLYYVSISRNQQNAFPDLQYVGVVYNGEDPSRFPIVTEPDDYVCFLGRFDREKDPHLAIQLAITLGIPIKVAGKIDHQGEGYFDEEIRPLLDNPLVEYLGELGFQDKVDLLSHARCNLHPTGFREPFGLTVLEAAYCGTPTLAIERGSMPELVEEGRTGMLVEDFVEGYHEIQRCFDMDRAYIAQRARMLFNYRTMTKQYLKAYEKVIDIFHTRRDQDGILRRTTEQTRHDISGIWNSGPHGATVPAPRGDGKPSPPAGRSHRPGGRRVTR